MLTDDGAPNRFFLMYLFCNKSMAIQYLKDIGLLRSKMQCNTCGRDMTWSADSSKLDGFRWRDRPGYIRHHRHQVAPRTIIILTLGLVLLFF